MSVLKLVSLFKLAFVFVSMHMTIYLIPGLYLITILSKYDHYAKGSGSVAVAVANPIYDTRKCFQNTMGFIIVFFEL